MDEEIIERVLLMQRLQMKLNPTQTCCEMTGDKPTVTIEIAGHVCGLYICIYAHGWAADKKADWSCQVYLDEPEAKSQLDKCISVLYHYLSVEEAKA